MVENLKGRNVLTTVNYNIVWFAVLLTFTMNPDSSNPFLNAGLAEDDPNDSFLHNVKQQLFADNGFHPVFPVDNPLSRPLMTHSTPRLRFAPPTFGTNTQVQTMPTTAMPAVDLATNVTSPQTCPTYQPIFCVQAPPVAKTIRPFSGFAQEDGTKFIQEFESYLTLAAIDPDSPRAVAAFHLHLNGPARIWFDALTVKDTWLAVKTAFMDEYCQVTNPTWISDSVVFDSLHLKAGQPIEDFHSLVLEKGRKLQKTETDMLNKFIGGLPGQLAFFVRAGRVATFREALQSAKIGEAHG